MKKYLEYKDDKSQKFWEIELIGNQFTTRYGKIGTDGTSKTKEFESEEKAQKEFNKLVKAKEKKGYAESVQKKSKTEKTKATPNQKFVKSKSKTSKVTSVKVETVEDLLKVNMKLAKVNLRKKDSSRAELIQILDQTPHEVILEAASQLKSGKEFEFELARRYLEYLWLSNIQNKTAAICNVFMNSKFQPWGFFNEDNRMFCGNYPITFKGETDNNIDIAKSIMTIPKDQFETVYIWEHALVPAFNFLLTAAHYPSVFDFLIEKMLDKDTDALIKKQIIASYFHKEHYTDINSSLKFTKTQVNKMLDAIASNWDSHKDYFIKEIDNPLAKNWLETKLKDSNFVKNHENANSILNDALARLEGIEKGVYLEYKDEKSHKLWKIVFNKNTYTLSNGKFKTGLSQSDPKEFDSVDEAIKKGEKLIASKRKSGFMDANEQKTNLLSLKNWHSCK